MLRDALASFSPRTRRAGEAIGAILANLLSWESSEVC